MEKDKKIGFLVAVMLLGLYNIPQNTLSAQAKTEGFIITADEQKTQESAQVKANKETFEKAKSLMNEKNYNAAIDYLTAYINGKPKRYEAYKLRGECYYALRRYDLARDDFQTAVNIKTSDDKFATGAKVVGAVVLGADKNDQKQNTELGNLYGQLMYAQKALNDPVYEDTYKKAFEYNSHIYLPQPKKNDVAKINCPQKYGKLLTPTGIDEDIQSVVENIESGNYHEAAYKVSKITSEYPDYYYGYYLTGVVTAGLEQEKDAIPMFEKAIEINPYDFESMASLGQIYYSEAEKYLSADYVNKSVEYFEKAISQNPNCYIYHFYLGLNNLLLSKNDKAINEFDNAISMKSNDYNSMYYKLIAQYLKGDNNGVVDGSAKLLNKHVSNSNSVLYLKALANYGLGNNDEALSDVEKAFSNINDFYNADIKRVSEKEKTLPSYLYLLKAQILKAKGEDSSQDFAKAYENPIIRTMTRNINTEINISPIDFENQLDYIRTAFIDKKIMMKYIGSEYKVSNLGPKDSTIEQIQEDSIVEEPSSLALALATGELSSAKAEDKSAQISMKQTTAQEEMVSDNKPSIAQMLAAQAVPKVEKSEVVIPGNTERPQENISDDKSEFKITYDSDVDMQNLLTVQEKSKDSVIVTAGDVITVTEDNVDTKVLTENVEKENEIVATKTVVSAPVQKSTADFNIIYDTPVVEQNSSKDASEEIEKISENLMSVNSFENMDEPVIITENMQEIVPVVSTPVVSEKSVDNLPQSKPFVEEPVKAVAKEIKETKDFKISYDEPAPLLRQPAERIEQEANTLDTSKDIVAAENEIVKQGQKVQDDITKLVESHLGGSSPDIAQIVENVQQAPEITETVWEARKINEKYANVDLNEFNIKKPVPEVESTDEIVVFEPNTFIEHAEEKLATDDFGLKDPTKQITDNFAQIQKQAKEYVESMISENNAEIAKTQQEVANNVENINQTVAQVEKEPELIVQEAVISEPVQEITKEAEKSTVRTIEKAQKVVPSVNVTQSAKINDFPKEDIVASQTITEAQEILNEFENKKRAVTENFSEEAVQVSDNKNLWDFLSDDFDAESVSKVKDKKMKKINKRSRKEAQIASIVQETIVGDNLNSNALEIYEESQSKRSWFKRTKKSEKFIDNSIENDSEKIEKKTKSIKNIFKRNNDRIKTDTDSSVEKVKRTWFKHKENTLKTVDNTVQKEQKKINWFKKKEKNIENSFDNLEPKKEKRTFSFKKLFHRTKGEE